MIECAPCAACRFKTLAAALTDPGEFLLFDFAKFERPALLHVGFQAVDAFLVRAGMSGEHGKRGGRKVIAAVA